MAMCENDSVRQLLARVQTQAAFVHHPHAYSILFLQKLWSVTFTHLHLGVEVEREHGNSTFHLGDPLLLFLHREVGKSHQQGHTGPT